jgi:hypothetical protein
MEYLNALIDVVIQLPYRFLQAVEGVQAWGEEHQTYPGILQCIITA